MNKERFLLRFDMRADAGDEAEVMVYSSIENEKWCEDDVTPKDFDAALKGAVKDGKKRLTLRVNSPGGDVYSAVAMRSMVMNAGFDSVKVMIEGLCASAATLFATIPGAEVVIAEGSEFMIHNPMTIAIGNSADMEAAAEHLRKLEGQFHGMYASKTGQDESVIKEWMDNETWFTAKEAVENGFCDEVLESAPVAACVSARDMLAMRAIYRHVPEEIVQSAERRAQSADTSSTAFGGPPSPEGKATPPSPSATPPERAHQGAPLQGEAERAESAERRAQLNSVSAARSENEAGINGDNDVSNVEPQGGEATEIQNQEENPTMDIKDINVDQLREENPALLNQIVQDAVNAERERINDIDALTDPGYEELAQQAKADGKSASEFVKMLVAAKKQKGADFIKARKDETAQAASVAGGAPGDNETDEEKILAAAKEIAGYAMGYSSNNDEGMF